MAPADDAWNRPLTADFRLAGSAGRTRPSECIAQHNWQARNAPQTPDQATAGTEAGPGRDPLAEGFFAIGDQVVQQLHGAFRLYFDFP